MGQKYASLRLLWQLGQDSCFWCQGLKIQQDFDFPGGQIANVLIKIAEAEEKRKFWSWTSGKKRNKISEKGARGGGQRLFVNFPKNHKFCRIQASLRNIWTCPSSAQCTPPHLPQGEREQSLLDRSWRLTEACSSGHSHFQDLGETVCKSKIQKIPFTRKLNEDTWTGHEFHSTLPNVQP